MQMSQRQLKPCLCLCLCLCLSVCILPSARFWGGLQISTGRIGVSPVFVQMRTKASQQYKYIVAEYDPRIEGARAASFQSALVKENLPGEGVERRLRKGCEERKKVLGDRSSGKLAPRLQHLRL